MERLPAKFTADQLREFCHHLRTCFLNGVDDQRHSLLSPAAVDVLGSMLVADDHISEFQHGSLEWLNWDGPALADKLLSCYGRENKYANGTNDWLRNMEMLVKQPVIDVRDKGTVLPFIQSISEVMHESGTKNSPESALVNYLILVLAGGEGSSKAPRANKTLQARLRISNAAYPMHMVKDFITRVLGMVNTAAKTLEEADQWEVRQAANPSGEGRGKRPRPTREEDSPPKQTHRCEGCGGETKKAGLQTCYRCAGHPDRNTSGPWAQSTACKTLKARLPHVIVPVLSNKRRLNGELLSDGQLKSMQEQSDALRNKPGKSPKGSKKGETLLSLSSAELNNALIPCTIFTNNGHSGPGGHGSNP